jgi:uncharacterized membrane protein YhaH (DUF805 family)
MQYWIGSLVALVPVLFAVMPLLLLGSSVETAAGTAEIPPPPASAGALTGGVMSVVVLAIYAVALWISLAVSVKRWHDHDKAGWWVLIAIVPVLGALASLVVLGCLPGTRGPNRFGDDPLEA